MQQQLGRPNYVFWKTLKTNPVPKYHAFFDAESYIGPEPIGDGTIQHHCRRVHLKFGEYENGKWINTTSVTYVDGWRDIWQWMASRSFSGYLQVWSHNISFDATITLLPHLLSEGFIIFEGLQAEQFPEKHDKKTSGKQIYFLPGKPVTVVDCIYTPNNAKLRLIDTCNFWRCTLDELGEQVQLPKFQMPDDNADNDEWQRYNERDVDIIMEAVRRMLVHCESGLIGPFRPTLGGLAFATYRKSHHRYSVAVRQNKLLRRAERAAYCGGQTECYRWGKVIGPVHQLDVVSLYPSVARDLFLPTQCVEMEWRKRTEATSRVEVDKQCIADVFIESDNDEFPYKTTNQTHYCIGRFWTVLCGEELQYAKRIGAIKKVASVIRYNVAPIFRSIFTALLARREDALNIGDTFTAKLLKELCNSLIGKVAQRGDKWITLGRDITEYFNGFETHYDYSTDTIREFRTISGITQESIRSDDSVVSFPAISAFITAYARQYMRRLRSIAGVHNTYYQATDCLHVSGSGRANLEQAGMIAKNIAGKLDEKGIAQDVIYRGANFYCLDHQWIQSSVSGRAKPVNGELYTDYLWESLASSLTRSPDNSFHVSKIDKLITPNRIEHWRIKNGCVQRLAYDVDMPRRPLFGNDFWKGDLQCT